MPPGFEGSGFAPAAFVFFATPEAAQTHEDDADVRRGNVLIVFHGEVPEAQGDFIDGCLQTDASALGSGACAQSP